MRSLILLFATFSCLLAEELDLPEGVDPPSEPHDAESMSANLKYFRAVDQARAEYRARLATNLRHADAVEIYLLDFETVRTFPEGEGDAFFPILPYRQHSKILDRRRLVGEELAKCFSTTSDLLNAINPPGGADCHFPIHGVRFYRGNLVLFETSLCWKCSNYYVCYPDDEKGSWTGISSQTLKEFLLKQLPIPDAEKTRFDAKYGPKKATPTSSGEPIK